MAAVQDLSAARTLDEVMAIVRTAARDLVGSDGCTFVLRDGDRCHYADEEAIEPLWKGQRFPMRSCISGWVMLNGRPAVVPDIYADARIPHDAYRPTFVHSLTMVPIRASDPLGAIGNYWARSYTPSQEDVEVLQALADTTAVALRNVTLLRELQSRVDEGAVQLSDASGDLLTMTHTLSHDLRAPLRAIHGLAELLQARHGASIPAEAQPWLDAIRGNASRLSDLFDALLLLSSAAQQPMRKVPIDMDALVGNVVREAMAAQRAAEPGRRIEAHVHELEPCTGDATLLRQVFVNLVSNALKFARGRDPVRLDVTSRRDGDAIVYTVQDNGIGFDDAQARTLFAPFLRLHHGDGFAGSGIGLSIVQRIAQRHGGHAWAQGEPGKGARMSVRLPG